MIYLEQLYGNKGAKNRSQLQRPCLHSGAQAKEETETNCIRLSSGSASSRPEYDNNRPTKGKSWSP